KIHKTVHLFPRAQRADAGSWGEISMKPLRDGSWVDELRDTNVAAHECGHLFNFPDEYWEYGGWVHRMYINNSQLDFAVGDINTGRQIWQVSSPKSVMGHAGGKAIPSAQNALPSAAVSP